MTKKFLFGIYRIKTYISIKIPNLKSFLSRFIFVFSTYELETITSLGFILAITEETFSIVVDNVDTLPVEIST